MTSINTELIAAQNQATQAAFDKDYSHLGEQLSRRDIDIQQICAQVAQFGVAIPSWGVGTGGTRFARFPGPGEPQHVFDKIQDCGVIHQLTRATPAVSLHIPWDNCSDWGELRDRRTALMAVMFPPQEAVNTLGEVLSKRGLTQLRIAETEKYAHVTFFLNGGVEAEFPGESRILVPSPKVATYDLQPEMSAPEVTAKIVDAIENRRFDVIIVNYANGDMVGHTGFLDAAIKAAEAIDTALGQLEAALRKAGGCMLISADHGNLEMMRDPETGEPHTQHTLFRVPLVLVNGPPEITSLSDGKLSDLAPTVLDLLHLAKPPEMTGHSLLSDHVAAGSRRVTA